MRGRVSGSPAPSVLGDTAYRRPERPAVPVTELRYPTFGYVRRYIYIYIYIFTQPRNI
jgi:hypothetical protein